MSTCSTCGAPIIWAITAKNGKPHPVDAASVDAGDLVLVGAAGSTLTVEHVNLETPVDAPRYVSHFATCPDADKHRKLSARQELALGFIRQTGTVSSDELGAVLHQDRMFRGHKGHHVDERCEFCSTEGAEMGRRLRELGLVEKVKGLDGGWRAVTSNEGEKQEAPSSQLDAGDPFPEGY